MEKAITGMMIYYHEVCDKKLWYFYHQINMEQDNENVKIGKILDETSYKRDDKHINIDNVINIDFIRDKQILHEVKKSNKIEEASVWQVKYYLYYLKQRNVTGIIGKIDYPLLKKNLIIELTDTDCESIEKKLEQIKNIVKLDKAPLIKKTKICKACAYYDLCYI